MTLSQQLFCIYYNTFNSKNGYIVFEVFHVFAQTNICFRHHLIFLYNSWILMVIIGQFLLQLCPALKLNCSANTFGLKFILNFGHGKFDGK